MVFLLYQPEQAKTHIHLLHGLKMAKKKNTWINMTQSYSFSVAQKNKKPKYIMIICCLTQFNVNPRLDGKCELEEDGWIRHNNQRQLGGSEFGWLQGQECDEER